MAALAYKSYRSTRHAWDDFQAVHGTYEGMSTGVWIHRHAQIFVPLRGRLHLSWRGEGTFIGPERAVLIPAGTAHEATTLGGELEFLALNVPPDWLPRLGEQLGCAVPGAPDVTLLADSGLWLAARQLAGALGTRGPGFERLLSSGADQLGIYTVQALSAPSAVAEPDAMLRAVDAVLRDFAEPLTVEGLASGLAMSPRQFERRFKAAVGMPPRAFLIGVRLAAARDRLAATDQTVEAIAASVGFGHISHFTRTFTRAMGMSPTAYRRARRHESAR